MFDKSLKSSSLLMISKDDGEAGSLGIGCCGEGIDAGVGAAEEVVEAWRAGDAEDLRHIWSDM
jgi:hypothetical protein